MVKTIIFYMEENAYKLSFTYSRMAFPKDAKKVYDGRLFEVYEWEQKEFDGGIKTYSGVLRRPTVQIIAVHENKIVLLKESQALEMNKISIPGGQVEDGEEPKTAALRELKEETGMEPEEMNLWREWEFTPGIQWTSYYFIAKNCKKVSKLNPDSGELIDPYEVTFEELFNESEKPNFRNRTFTNWLYRMKQNRKEFEEFRELLGL